MLKSVILIGIGGGIGSISRYLVYELVARYFSASFPMATFAVNVIGCLIVGLVFGMFEAKQMFDQNIKFMLVTGFCGGFTTFSAFSLETTELIAKGNMLTAISYVTLSIAAGVLAVYLGMTITKNLF